MDSLLLLSAGRRVSLLRAFEKELAQRKPGGVVFAADAHPELSSACMSTRHRIPVPAVGNPDYLATLLAICIERSIGLVIPTIDTELAVLAEARERFEGNGIQLALSSLDLVQKCRDKRQAHDLFKALNMDTPAIYTRRAVVYPCFGKPYDGSRSVGAAIIRSEEETDRALRNNPKTIFMELVDTSGADEYTVDIYYDRHGKLRCAVPRKRLAVRDGEVSKGITLKDDVLEYVTQHMSILDGARGCLTLQLFRSREGRTFKAIELNPRFGGGYPLSYAAGANFPGWLIDEYLGGKNIEDFSGWQSGLLMLRYDAEVFVSGSAN